MPKISTVDEADEQTEKRIADLEKRIKKQYSLAQKEMKEKYISFLSSYAQNDIKKQEDFKNGKITQEEYDKWVKGQVLTSKKWEAMLDTLTDELTRADQIAASIINNTTPSAYALNYNYGVFETEKGSHIDTSFTLYSRESVERLIYGKSAVLPAPSVDIPKDKRWNRRHLESAVTQGILQGDDLKTVANRFIQVTDMDQRAALRNARTAMTGAQNAGRLAAYRRAQKMGITVYKKWMATLDSHTRSSHQHLDGERAPINKKFSNGCLYPGDIYNGAPEEIYNCRCTMIADVPEYQYEDMKRYDNIAGKKIENVTYAEWLKAHQSGNLNTKKEYDFAGKKEAYRIAKENLESAEGNALNAQYYMYTKKTREDYIQELNDRYKEVTNFTEEDVSKIKKRIDELDKEIKEAEAVYDKWYDKPQDYDEVLEWRKWKREWEEEHGMSAPDYTLKLQEEYYSYLHKVNDYDSYHKKLEMSSGYMTKAELLEASKKAEEELEKAKEAYNRFTPMDKMLMDAYDKGIPYKKVDVLNEKLSGIEIIQKLAGGDETDGSCQSLALCYAGNRAGIDVIDFRGEDSQKFFSAGDFIKKLINAGVKGSSESGYSEQAVAWKLLKGMENNKEYILAGGQHAAVVRKTDFEYQFLELQSSRVNGWKTLGVEEKDVSETLKWRFGMQKSHTWNGHRYERSVELIEVDSVKDVENFDVLLGFCNTDPDKQMKGAKGSIK